MEKPACELREELKRLGIDSSGSRSDLISRLSNGSTELLNEAPTKSGYSNVFEVRGQNQESYLMRGSYSNSSLCVDSVLNLQSRSFDADLVGSEGDLRRTGSKLFMYRSSGCEPGWYPFEFGRLRVI